ncbi:MAG: CAP domain-containing protein [Neisseria sp.]|nr:CAP domain-containing protein [Neisseria sp.]
MGRKARPGRLAVWLLLLGLCLVSQRLFYSAPSSAMRASPAQNRAGTRGLDSLAYLNLLRREAGLPAFAYSPALQQSAAGHARYLAAYPSDGHYERHTDSPLFVGESAEVRARRAGYPSSAVQENLSTITQDPAILDSPPPEHRHLDRLMTAIYHRFSLLDPDSDEAGASFALRGGNHALVVNQGSSQKAVFCRRRDYAPEWCSPPPKYVAYPLGGGAAPDFLDETPDPLPDYDYSGNPVSIAFSRASAAVRMLSFELYRGDGRKVENTRLLDKGSDPNGLLSDRQFALFPLQPLQYDTEYRAVFRYLYAEGGEAFREEKAEWSFRTKKPDFDYFQLSGGEDLRVENGRAYFLRWPPNVCRGGCRTVSYRAFGNAELVLHESRYDGILVSVRGRQGGIVRLKPDGAEMKNVVLHIK